MEEPEGKNPHFLYTRLILDLMRASVSRWSPLIHTSHCMITRWPAAATQMTATVSPTMCRKIFLCRMPLLPQPSVFSGSETGSCHLVSQPFSGFTDSQPRSSRMPLETDRAVFLHGRIKALEAS